MNSPISVDLQGSPWFCRNYYGIKLPNYIECIQRLIIKWELNERTILLTPEQTVALMNMVQKQRSTLGLSINEVARRAKVDTGTVWRIEQGMIAKPTAKSLMAIGEVLGIPAIDLFSIAGWISADELPSLGTYLRTKLNHLPTEAVEDIEAYIASVARKYAVKLEGEYAVSTPSARTSTKEN